MLLTESTYLIVINGGGAKVDESVNPLLSQPPRLQVYTSHYDFATGWRLRGLTIVVFFEVFVEYWIVFDNMLGS